MRRSILNRIAEMRRIYIIDDDADRMNAGAQDTLVKTLEEPPAYAVILLLTNNKDRLHLDTILSRCVST